MNSPESNKAKRILSEIQRELAKYNNYNRTQMFSEFINDKLQNNLLFYEAEVEIQKNRLDMENSFILYKKARKTKSETRRKLEEETCIDNSIEECIEEEEEIVDDECDV